MVAIQCFIPTIVNQHIPTINQAVFLHSLEVTAAECQNARPIIFRGVLRERNEEVHDHPGTESIRCDQNIYI